MKKSALKQLGFTLIELMVVVAIIAILMSGGILAFTNAQQNARDARRRADLDAISKAMEQYYQNNNGQYPASNGGITSYFPSNTPPVDPQGSSYTITYTATAGQGFCACAQLERTTKGNASNNGSIGAGSCSWSTVSPTHFCVTDRQ